MIAQRGSNLIQILPVFLHSTEKKSEACEPRALFATHPEHSCCLGPYQFVTADQLREIAYFCWYDCIVLSLQ